MVTSQTVVNGRLLEVVYLDGAPIDRVLVLPSGGVLLPRSEERA